MPGLEFKVTGDEQNRHDSSNRHLLDPVGLFGLFYWYGIYPLHQMVFAGMLRKLASAAEQAREPGRGK